MGEGIAGESVNARRSTLTVLHRPRVSLEDAPAFFLVERSPQLTFFGGYHSFPGGAVDEVDARLPTVSTANLVDDERTLRAAALRELFEETGVLLVTDILPAVASRGLPALREQLLKRDSNGEEFFHFLTQQQLSLDLDRLVPLTRLITPKFSPKRYDATYYLVECDEDPQIIDGELVGGRWLDPASALAAWSRGEIRIAAPIVTILRVLAWRRWDQALEELSDFLAPFEGSGRLVPLAPGYDVVPLRTPPLPSSLPTTTFLIGDDEFVVVDPGPKAENEQAHLLTAIDRRMAAGGRPLAVVLTHHHADHVGALDAVVNKLRVPLWAHPLTGELLERDLDRELLHGDIIDLGRSPDGRDGWNLRVLFTPGHAVGHVALYDAHYRRVVAGDLVSTTTSMYVGSPGGNLQDYMQSLEQLLALDLESLYPSHGVPSHNPQELLRATLLHRQERLEQVAGELDSEPQDVESVAQAVYTAAPKALRPLTVRTTRANLQHLAVLGRAREVETDRYVLIESPSAG